MTKDNNSAESHRPIGPEEEHSGLEDGQHDPTEFNNQSGTARVDLIDVCGGGGGEEDKLVDIEKVIERYRINVPKRNGTSTRAGYAGTFRAFMRTVPDITRRQLAGPKGKRALIEFLNDKRAAYRAGVKKIWLKGLGLAWPIDNDDLDKAPKVKQSVAPETKKVIAFHEAMMKGPDAKRQLSWLMIASYGWSPADVINLNPGEVQEWNGLYYISRDREKTGAEYLTVITTEIKELIEKVGRFGVEKKQILKWWDVVAKKYKVARLTPRQLRKWVKVRAREAGLNKPATSMMMGHDTGQGDMQDWYDKPPIEEILDAQSRDFPQGALGCVLSPTVEIVEEDSEAMVIWHEFKADKIGTMELATKLEKLKSRLKISVPNIG